MTIQEDEDARYQSYVQEVLDRHNARNEQERRAAFERHMNRVRSINSQRQREQWFTDMTTRTDISSGS